MSMQRLYACALAATVLTVLLLANIPPFTLPGNPSDKLQHVVAFAVLAWLAAGTFPSWSMRLLWAWLAAFAGTIEFVQLLLHQGREADELDFIAGMAGATGVLLIIFLARRSKARAKVLP